MSYRARGGSTGRLWFGLLGGAVAWAAHLLLSYLLVEITCATSLPGFTLLGFNGSAVMLLALTLLSVLVALAAALVAYQDWRRFKGSARGAQMLRNASSDLSLIGFLLSGLFVLIILIEGLPIFFLRACGV